MHIRAVDVSCFHRPFCFSLAYGFHKEEYMGDEVTRFLLISAMAISLAACGSVDTGGITDTFGEYESDHPLNGDWTQAQGGTMNSLSINPIASSRGDRYGHYEGQLVDLTENEISFEWTTDPQFTYRGELAVSYDAGLLIEPPLPPDRGNWRTVRCEFVVNRERTELVVGPGCVLFIGTFTQPPQPENRGIGGLFGR